MAPSRAPRIMLAGLELRYGTAEAPATPRASATPAPAPARSPVDAAVEAGVRRQREAAGKPPDDAATAEIGAPVSTDARHALDDVARRAGIDAGDMASVADSPHDQALFLVERMLDPRYGVAAVRARYGTAGALAAESYQRMRDIYRTVDLNAEQRQNLVVVVETALVVGGAVGQATNPDDEMVDVDPGARVDRARFEQAVAASRAIARCVRPTGRAGDRRYLLEIPRHGVGRGGAICANDWDDSDGTTVVVQPPSAEALARFTQSVAAAPLTTAAADRLGPPVATAPATSAALDGRLGPSVATAPLTDPAASVGPGHAIETVLPASVRVPAVVSPSLITSPLIATVSNGPLGSVVTRVLGR
ncbi:MAG TPA: hypothetical protein VMB81_14300 [Candidatus Sulfotelmatobacter sp.]|nr:hypothetical protein [Candidatus Sulfotelmatobacter sp.]